MDKYRIIAPEQLEHDFITRFPKAPQAKYFAISLKVHMVLHTFWMPTHVAIVTRYTAQCIECQLKIKSVVHKKNHKDQLYIQKTNYLKALFYKVAFGKHPKSYSGHELILTCWDNFTRFVWLVPLKDTKLETVLQALKDNIFEYFGLVDDIILDKSKSFISSFIKGICRKLNIDNRKKIPYCHNLNQSERIHNNIREILRELLSRN